jgi:hypothetical protein
VEGLRYLFNAEVLELSKDQDPPVFCREFNNCFANDPCCFSASERLERRLAGSSESIEIGERLTGQPALPPAI